MDAIPVLHKHFRTSRWLLVIATVSIVACCVWTLWQWTCRPQAALSVECKNRLRTVYMAWLQHQESRATNGVAQGGQPAKQEAVPKPFHMSELGIGDTFCPIVFGLTEGKVKSPFLLTYGFRKRGAIDGNLLFSAKVRFRLLDGEFLWCSSATPSVVMTDDMDEVGFAMRTALLAWGFCLRARGQYRTERTTL